MTLFAGLAISEHVRQELIRQRLVSRLRDALAARLSVHGIQAEEITRLRTRYAGRKLHDADLSVIALSARLEPEVVLTDDLRLRKALEEDSRRAVGSIGVLVRAYSTGLLTHARLLDSIDSLLDDSSLYTSSAFRERIRRQLTDLDDDIE